MRSATLAFAVFFALGVVGLLCVGLIEQRSEAFTLGVQPAQQTYVRSGSRICQEPIDVQVGFSALRFTISAAVVKGPRALVTIDDARSGRRLSAATLPGGYPSRTTELTVPVHPIAYGRRIRVCLRPSGRLGLIVFGNAAAAARGSSASLNGKPLDRDIDLAFLRAHRTSVLGLTGDIVARASLFHGGWVGTWTLWGLVALLLTAFPALLVFALARSGAGSGAEATDQPMASASE
jgi:hypothetical protein